MKQLTLLRHAHAAWPENRTRDFDRPLDDLGRKGLLVIAPSLARLVRTVDLVLLSPAARAVQSYDILAQHMNLPQPVRDPNLYMAGEDQLLDILHAQPDDVQHIFIIGHNPGLQYLLSLLLTAPSATPLAHHFPTSAYAQLESAAPWAEWEKGDVKLRAHNWPQNIDPDIEADR